MMERARAFSAKPADRLGIMGTRIALLTVVAASLLAPAPATAADLPPVRSSERNAVPECVTPGRLMAFLKSRNENLDPRFEKIAVEYMRHGDELGLRWDYAFFQMVIETGYLTFKRDNNRQGLVKATQNNFAGLGATGKGQHGESFKDVSTGVLAHLQHVLMYTGEPIENPVAERTRKVIEWGVLDAWRKTIKGPMTFTQLARRWASSDEYVEAIEAHANRFYENFCNKPDPDPELLAEARPSIADKSKHKTELAAETKAKPAVSGLELARQAIEEGKAEGNDRRSALGGMSLLAKPGDAAKPDATKAEDKADAKDTKSSGAYALLNPKAPEQDDKLDKGGKPATMQTASIASGLSKQAPAAPPPSAKCRVWTASYGGQKAVLIRAQAGNAVNYTVLDVNEGAEKREAEAYIAAYAKGGTIAGEFQSQSNALDKAFELCPEG
jgi:hypothetical protein